MARYGTYDVADSFTSVMLFMNIYYIFIILSLFVMGHRLSNFKLYVFKYS